MPVPNYFLRLGVSQKTTCDSTIRQSFIAAWTALHQRVDLGIAQVQEEGEQLLMAFEMLQCESSRECVLSVLQTGKLTCRLPPEKIMSWKDAMAAEMKRNAQQKEGTWTEKCEKDHQETYDKAGYLWKKRSPPTERTMVEWIRYHCAFNAYAVLGIPYDATPEQIQAAFDEHVLPDDLDDGERDKYQLCLQTALEMALSPLAERYRSWLGQGFVDIMHDHIPMRLPATRTNVMRELGLFTEPQKGKRKAPADPVTSLQKWLATAKNPEAR